MNYTLGQWEELTVFTRPPRIAPPTSRAAPSPTATYSGKIDILYERAGDVRTLTRLDNRRQSVTGAPGELLTALCERFVATFNTGGAVLLINDREGWRQRIGDAVDVESAA